ncbi:hypothetical protein IGI04_021841 [Brassica rapa subsp. trilocularis]|uniref:Uncharacterized protein n=1 Tax=Brassica rapa subsp. trilocularis TaxID=1813537 RepID=A0ABQ7LZ82_BRACM|nr:hypothetical protein IGI04_021841 [Brassica rapa subsp. trilocularis]
MEPTAAKAAVAEYGNRDEAAVKEKQKRLNGDGMASRSWSFSDPESRRKRRVAAYKVLLS